MGQRSTHLIGKCVTRDYPLYHDKKWDFSYVERPVIIEEFMSDGRIRYESIDDNGTILDKTWDDGHWVRTADCRCNRLIGRYENMMEQELDRIVERCSDENM